MAIVLWTLFAAASPLRAEETTLFFDFGTLEGKTTPLAAGFGQWLTDNGTFADLADGLEVRVHSDSGFQNLAFLRSFDGLGGGHATDFTLRAEIRVKQLAGSSHENNDRWGLLLFGSPGSETADTNGISAQVLAKANTSTGESLAAQLVLRDGVNGTILASANWIGGPIVEGDALRLEVAGTYANAAELTLAFTLGRLDGSQSQSISTGITGAKVGGTHFGGALRIKNGRAIEYDSLSLTADFPEPSLPPVPERLVAEGPDGLVYSPYANQGQTQAVHTVPDFSRAGYKGGGVPIPFVPAVIVLEPQAGDDHARIQEAIQTVAGMPLGPDGFRGAILLRAGDYQVSGTLNVNASGIVIRGEGSQSSGGTRILHTATTQSNLFRFQGASNPSNVSGTLRAVTDGFVPVGSLSLHVEDASVFAPGDRVRVVNTVNQSWIDAIGMNLVNPAWTPSGFQLGFERFVTAVEGKRITLDAPIVQAIESRYGGATVQRQTFNGAIRDVGIEAIRLESAFASATDENHGWIAIQMQRVADGWVRQVTARYFGYGAVSIGNYSQFVTVEDSAMLDPMSQTTGSRKYSFHVDDSNYVLMQRNLTRGGRHDFVTGSLTPGPNAFVDGLATQSTNDTGPHFRYATGQIYDNIKTDHSLRVQNRFNSGTSHGWSGAQILFWNVQSPAIVSQAPAGAMNWTVGAVGARRNGEWRPDEPDGIWESPNAHVQPRSLFYAQLRDRLGPAAVRRVRLPRQESGPIWNELLAWNGEGRFGDALLALTDAEAPIRSGTPISLMGIVRDLRIAEDLTQVAWSLVSGPGLPTFAEASTLETPAVFPLPGSYLLSLAVTGAGRTESKALLVQILAPDAGDIPPAAPEISTALFANGEVTLQWEAGAGTPPASYNIYRSLVPNAGAFPILTALPSNHFTDTDIEAGVRYYYAVSAVDADGNESPRSGERFVTALGGDGHASPNVGATDSAYTRAGQGVLDSSQWLGIKRSDFTGTARVAFLRFPLSAPGRLGGLDPDDIASASLAIHVTQNEPADTLRLYALLDGAQASAAHLSESTWTGGSHGTAASGKNLQASNRPDGGGSLPNVHTSVELGSITFPGPAGGPINTALGLHTLAITNLEAFRQLLRDDANGEITLLLRGQLDREFNQIASTFNTNGHRVPTLVLAAAGGFADLNENGIDDAWERANFGDLLEGDAIVHASGIPYYFLYLSGADPENPEAGAGRIFMEGTASGDGAALTWEFLEEFHLGEHFEIRFSTNLVNWLLLPPNLYQHEPEHDNGRTRHRLRLTDDAWRGPAFFQLRKP